VRAPGEIERDIERLARRRSRLLSQLAERPRPDLARERARLDARMAELWSERRTVRAALRFGTRASIVERARREQRIPGGSPRPSA
jgi:hypothetical protein